MSKWRISRFMGNINGAVDCLKSHDCRYFVSDAELYDGMGGF